jgi:hypothetical protein
MSKNKNSTKRKNKENSEMTLYSMSYDTDYDWFVLGILVIITIKASFLISLISMITLVGYLIFPHFQKIQTDRMIEAENKHKQDMKIIESEFKE